MGKPHQPCQLEVRPTMQLHGTTAVPYPARQLLPEGTCFWLNQVRLLPARSTTNMARFSVFASTSYNYAVWVMLKDSLKVVFVAKETGLQAVDQLGTIVTTVHANGALVASFSLADVAPQPDIIQAHVLHICRLWRAGWPTRGEPARNARRAG